MIDKEIEKIMDGNKYIPNKLMRLSGIECSYAFGGKTTITKSRFDVKPSYNIVNKYNVNVATLNNIYNISRK